MGDVAHDDGAQTVDLPKPTSQSEQVAERLGWMLMPSVAPVDHRHVDPIGDARWCASGAVANDERVDAHRLNRQSRVTQRLAFGHRRRRRGEGHHIGREALSSGLKGQAGSRGVLKEEGGDRTST